MGGSLPYNGDAFISVDGESPNLSSFYCVRSLWRGWRVLRYSTEMMRDEVWNNPSLLLCLVEEKGLISLSRKQLSPSVWSEQLGVVVVWKRTRSE
jgi:hypothetical protein